MPLTVWIHSKLWKTLKEIGVPNHLTVSCESCMQVKKQQLEPDVEQQIGFELGMEYVKKDVYIITLLI